MYDSVSGRRILPHVGDPAMCCITYRAPGGFTYAFGLHPTLRGDVVDAAAGIHVRLRLGGDGWPPQILYSVYVHGCVVDLCSDGMTNGARGEELPTDSVSRRVQG